MQAVRRPVSDTEQIPRPDQRPLRRFPCHQATPAGGGSKGSGKSQKLFTKPPGALQKAVILKILVFTLQQRLNSIQHECAWDPRASC